MDVPGGCFGMISGCFAVLRAVGTEPGPARLSPVPLSAGHGRVHLSRCFRPGRFLSPRPVSAVGPPSAPARCFRPCADPCQPLAVLSLCPGVSCPSVPLHRGALASPCCCRPAVPVLLSCRPLPAPTAPSCSGSWSPCPGCPWSPCPGPRVLAVPGPGVPGVPCPSVPAVPGPYVLGVPGCPRFLSPGCSRSPCPGPSVPAVPGPVPGLTPAHRSPPRVPICSRRGAGAASRSVLFRSEPFRAVPRPARSRWRPEEAEPGPGPWPGPGPAQPEPSGAERDRAVRGRTEPHRDSPGRAGPGRAAPR